jgi:signal transduction histidine kinase
MQFSLIVLFILLFFTVGIYFFSSNYRDNDYRSRLKDRAITVANLFLGVEDIDEALLKIIDRNTLALYQEKIFLFDENNRQIYSNTDEFFRNASILAHVRSEGEYSYRLNERDAIGIKYTYNKHDYLVMASAYDYFGLAKMRNLSIVLFACFLFSLIVVVFAGFLYSERALKPISSIVNQVQKISITNLNLRVDEGNKTDEIAQLAITFNQMLQRLEEAFILQRDFVSNAAHELRTPFTVLLAEIDYSLMQDRTNLYYVDVLNKQRSELKRLSKLSNGLLDLARVSYDASNVVLKTIRIDELLVETCNDVFNSKSDYKIDIDFSGLPEMDTKLYVSCNEQLLKVAIKNLIENACKFSKSKQVKIQFVPQNDYVSLLFKDDGIGIHPDELTRIFQPFFRGKNTQFIAGYGLGLALTQKIVELHRGLLTVESEYGWGSTFTLTIPNRLHF